MTAQSNAMRLQPYQSRYFEQALPHVEIEGFIDQPAMQSLRNSLQTVPFLHCDVRSRGCYEYSLASLDASLVSAMVSATNFVTGRSLQVESSRWIRTKHRSYALLRDDPPRNDDAVEVILDVSAKRADEGQVVYTHREQPFFVMIPSPGTLAIVARGPTIQRYFRYIPHRAKDSVLLRLGLVLTDAGSHPSK